MPQFQKCLLSLNSQGIVLVSVRSFCHSWFYTLRGMHGLQYCEIMSFLTARSISTSPTHSCFLITFLAIVDTLVEVVAGSGRGGGAMGPGRGGGTTGRGGGAAGRGRGAAAAPPAAEVAVGALTGSLLLCQVRCTMCAYLFHLNLKATLNSRCLLSQCYRLLL